MASVNRVTYKSGRVVYRIVICMGYDNRGKKLVKNLTYSVNQSATPKQQEREAVKYANGLRVLKITLLTVPMQDINRH